MNGKESPTQELLVINEKDRQQVSFSGGFRYQQTGLLTSYRESVNSIERMTDEDVSKLRERHKAQVNSKRGRTLYEEEYYFLSTMMRDGRSYSQADLFRMLSDSDLNPNEVSKKRLRSAMKLFQGNHLIADYRGENNSKYYKWSAF